MKRIIIVFSLLLSLFNLTILFAGQSSTLNSKTIQVVSNSSQTELTFKLPDYTINKVFEHSTSFSRIKISDASFTIEEGKPELPFYTVTIAIPQNSSPNLSSIKTISSTSLDNISILPAQAIDAENKGFKFNAEFYTRNSRYPESNIQISDVQTIRDFNIVSVNIYPFIYNAQSKSLEVNKDIKIVISHDSKSASSTFQNNNTISREFEPIYRSLIANYDQIRADYPVYSQPHILYIYKSSTDANFNTAFNNMINWKKQKGFKVTIASNTLTGTTASSIKSYIQSLYNNTSERPDYVTLIGDVSGTFSIPTYTLSYASGCPDGAGDAPYTYLSGNDYLGDVMIGRMSFETVTQFQTMVSKVLLYEKNPTVMGVDWLKHSVLCAETSSSGNSTLDVSNYIKEIIQDYDNTSTFSELNPDPSVSTMQNAGSLGALFFTYRGYIGMNGLSNSDANDFTNDRKLFASVFITCGTGEFAGESFIEDITRVGTPSAPKGSIVSVGMSTIHTLTPYNNFMLGSIMHGHYLDGIGSFGGCTLFARVNLIQTYNGEMLDHSKTLGHWMNLMGDPSVNIYRTVPKLFSVQHDATLQIGQNFMNVIVKDDSNNPVKNAWVSLTNATYENLAYLVTDESGAVTLPVPLSFAGNLYLTVSNQDYKAYIATITQSTNSIVGVENYSINDALHGNNNQQVNPGETITYSLTIKNNTSNTVNNVNLLLKTDNPYVTITDSTATISTITANATANATDAFTFEVLSDYANNIPLNFSLIASDNTQTWSSMIFETVKAADLDIESISILNSSHVIELAVPANMSFSIKNNGSIDVQNVTAVLRSKSMFLEVSDSTSTLGNISAGSSISTTGDTFTVNALSGIFPGVKLKAEIEFSNANGFSETEDLLIQVGTVTTHDPIPPDPYGYVIYDITDTSYGDVPVYDWTDISTFGTVLNLYDAGENQDCSVTVPLPFTFKMYGQPSNNLTICSNGWASVSPTDQNDFRPLTLPNAIAPRGIIAPYWADLAKSGTGSNIFYYYDNVNHCFIVQWNNMKLVKDTQYDNDQITSNNVSFQAILYDPDFIATALGDSPIKFQYKFFHVGLNNDNLESLQNHFTCGIQDQSAQRGLTYCFNNIYYPGAAQLGNETALFITHPFFLNEAPYLMNSVAYLHDQNGNNIIEAGETVNIGLPLVNVGLMPATNVHATLSSSDPYITITSPNANYNNIQPSTTASNLDYYTVQVLPSCPDNYEINLNAHIISDQDEWNRVFKLDIKQPTLTYRSYLINDTNGNANGILEAGETAKLIINISNTSQLQINNANATITSTNTDITINDNNSFTKVMQSNTNYQNVFELTLSPNITSQTSIPLQVNISSANAPALNFTIQLGVNQSGALMQENFNTGLPQGWIIQFNSNNWSGSSTNNAGGTAPELNFSGTPVFNGLTRLISQTMETTDVSSVILSFNQKVDVLSPGTTIGVATRSNFSSWHIVWSEILTGSIPAQLKNIPINNSDLGNENLQICWFVDGNSANIQNWYIDDLSVQTNIGNTATVKGLVTIDDTEFDITKATVKAGEYAISPDSTGLYQLYLIPGMYSSITTILPYTNSNTVNNTNLTSGQIVDNMNFSLNYFMNPRNLNANVNTDTHQLTLNWSYALPDNSPLIFSTFNVYRQINSGNFELLNTTTQNHFTEEINGNNRYRYYISTQYTTGVSDSSNVVYINPGFTPSDIIETPVKFALNQNYPNPFNPTTNIAFSIPENSNVILNIYNIKGQLVKTLKNERMLKGNHTIQWNGVNQFGKSVSSGIYFIKLDTDKNHSVKKALLLK